MNHVDGQSFAVAVPFKCSLTIALRMIFDPLAGLILSALALGSDIIDNRVDDRA
jgi:hypothetical protein